MLNTVFRGVLILLLLLVMLVAYDYFWNPSTVIPRRARVHLMERAQIEEGIRSGNNDALRKLEWQLRNDQYWHCDWIRDVRQFIPETQNTRDDQLVEWFAEHAEALVYYEACECWRTTPPEP